MRNWTINEAVAVINANQDQEAIAEIAKHFPTFFMVVAKNDLVGLTSMMGEKFTVRRLNLNGAVIKGTEDGEVEATEATTEAGGEDLESMSTKQLMQLCDKRGIKVPHYGKNKQFYLEALQGTPEDGAEEAGEDEEENPYEGKTAMELFKLCKSRGIKAQSKKKAADYIKLLEKADAAEAEADATEEGEDEWGDEEEEAPAPKATKKAPAKSAPKAKGAKVTKEAEPEEDEAGEDDGDDWDI